MQVQKKYLIDNIPNYQEYFAPLKQSLNNWSIYMNNEITKPSQRHSGAMTYEFNSTSNLQTIQSVIDQVNSSWRLQLEVIALPIIPVPDQTEVPTNKLIVRNISNIPNAVDMNKLFTQQQAKNVIIRLENNKMICEIEFNSVSESSTALQQIQSTQIFGNSSTVNYDSAKIVSITPIPVKIPQYETITVTNAPVGMQPQTIKSTLEGFHVVDVRANGSTYTISLLPHQNKKGLVNYAKQYEIFGKGATFSC